VSAPRPAQVADPGSARDQARDILGDRRFHHDPAPRPFRGPLRWLGDRLEPIRRAIARAIDFIPWWMWLAIAAAITVAVIARIIMVSRLRRVSGLSAKPGAGRVAGDAPEDPDALERAADEAERDGDLDRAVRLRFRAGLLRLGDRGTIEYRPSVTTGEVRRVLGNETFDDLAETFEEVAYAGRPAVPPDVESARREWPRVLEETRPR
jgi:hypothetical protein